MTKSSAIPVGMPAMPGIPGVLLPVVGRAAVDLDKLSELLLIDGIAGRVGSFIPGSPLLLKNRARLVR